MKMTLIGIGSLILLGGLAWYEFGGPALILVVAGCLILLLILGAFAVGSWWSGKLMERGAEIALKAQLSDDRRDTIQVQALTGLIKETLKMKGATPHHSPDFPALPYGEKLSFGEGLTNGGVLTTGEETVDASFTIAGLEEETDLLAQSDQGPDRPS